jgi:hypothetical protein
MSQYLAMLKAQKMKKCLPVQPLKPLKPVSEVLEVHRVGASQKNVPMDAPVSGREGKESADGFRGFRGSHTGHIQKFHVPRAFLKPMDIAGEYLPYCVPFAPGEVAALRSALLADIDELAKLECWAEALRVEIIQLARNNALAALRSNAAYFRVQVVAARRKELEREQQAGQEPAEVIQGGDDD